MNSINKKNSSKKLYLLFDEIQKISKNRELNYFDLKPIKERTSYYSDKKVSEISPESFEMESSFTLDNFGSLLEKHWKNDGSDELLKLIPMISDIAKEFYNVEKQNTDVSPFIYVMF
ncbi:MAG: hypothetical protein NTY74_10985 [Ignavibacteriae bacterium]|nr:hypothetical protein [Ignavibacteriota bacterium]